MKKIIVTLILTTIMSIGLIGCSNDNNVSKNIENNIEINNEKEIPQKEYKDDNKKDIKEKEK